MEKAIGTRQGHGPEAPSAILRLRLHGLRNILRNFPKSREKHGPRSRYSTACPVLQSETLQYMLRKVLFIYNPSSGESPVAGRFDRIIELYQAHGLHMLFHRLAFDAGDEAVLAAVDGASTTCCWPEATAASITQ